MKQQSYLKLHPQAFALTAGVIWALGVLLVGLGAAYTGYALPMVELIASAYLGYEASLSGAVIGGIWGFFDAFIGCWIFAWAYNMAVSKMK